MQKVELASFKHDWAESFNQLKAILMEQACVIDAIEHIGSTAIKQAQAKNIIDLQILIASFDDFDELKKVLETLGFEYLENIKQDHVPFNDANYFETGWEKRFFTGMYNGQEYNIHIRLTNSKNSQFSVNFVNLLETNPDTKFAYLQFKARLAKAGVSQEDYCLVKDSVIDIISLLYT